MKISTVLEVVLSMFSQAVVMKPPAILQPRPGLLILKLLLSRPGFLVLGLLMPVKATTHVLLEELEVGQEHPHGRGLQGSLIIANVVLSKA